MPIDAATAKNVWNAKVGNINVAETMTMAPLVVEGRVLVGHLGRDDEWTSTLFVDAMRRPPSKTTEGGMSYVFL